MLISQKTLTYVVRIYFINVWMLYAMRDKKKTCKQISYDDGVWYDSAPGVMQHQSIHAYRQCFSIHNLCLL